MNGPDLAKLMKSQETFSGLTIPDGAWVAVRVDGRGFTKMTAAQYSKPFDERFALTMEAAARYVLHEVGGVFAYAQSDELSVLFPPRWDGFNRRVEKLVSVCAAAASAAFTHDAGVPVMFDGRVSVSPTLNGMVDYLSWRQADATRNALNSWMYWMLRHNGLTATDTHARMQGMGVDAKHEFLAQQGVPFPLTSSWQRLGTGFWYETEPRVGDDPRTGESVTSTRRVLSVHRDLPVGQAFRATVTQVLEPFAAPQETCCD